MYTAKDLIMRRETRRKEKGKKMLASSSDWSKLSPDVLRKILGTLSPVDSHRAKMVCSDWCSVWKTCDNLPPRLFRIIHQGGTCYERISKESCYVGASSGNWLLMVDYRLDFYLLNFSTRERINLPAPSIRGQDNGRRFDRTSEESVWKDFLQWKNAAVLWIDERAGDYFIACIFRQRYLISYMKGDDSWSELKVPPGTENASYRGNDSWSNLNMRRGTNYGFRDASPRSNLNMRRGTDYGFRDAAFRNSKLYVLTTDQHIMIFDLSGRLVPRIENPYRNHPFRFDEKPWEYVWKMKIAVEESGEVLIILSLKEVKYEEILLFYVFKMNLESGEWERVYSIGDNEMLIFGHGVTLKAPVRDIYGHGITSDSINFVVDDVWPDHDDHVHHALDCGFFDLATSTIEWRKKTGFYLNKTQWFVPGVAY